MTHQQDVRPSPAGQHIRDVTPGRILKFGNDTAFQLELRRRVDEHFRTAGRRQRDCWQMYVKTAILLAAFAGSYWLLVFGTRTWWQALPLAILLGLSAAGIGFNVQHDGGHQAYSSYAWINKLMAMTLELIGGSSYLWRWKHVVFHHTYVNITGHDTDIDLGMLARLTPHQRRLAFHRWQHLYLWPLYGVLAIKWQLLDDFRKLISGRISNQPFPRPRGWDLVTLAAGKATFFAVAFVIPLHFHSPGAVLFYYGIAGLVTGTVLSVVFQVAHCVEEAEFPVPRASTGRIDRAWAIHQAETTVDFARRSCMVTWLVGGLVSPDQPRQLPGNLTPGARDLPSLWDQIRAAQVVPGGPGITFPLAATDGDVEHGLKELVNLDTTPERATTRRQTGPGPAGPGAVARPSAERR
jgi:linoleoyl-CoA desaturase